MLIPIAQIAIINRQRTERDLAQLQDLAASIKETGLLHPIVVRRPHAGEDCSGLPYVLVVGGGRIGAHLILAREHIEGRLFEDLDPVSAEVAELDENLRRSDLSWQDEIEAKARIHDLRIMQKSGGAATAPNAAGRATLVVPQTLSDTAAELGVNVGNLSREMKLHEAMKKDPQIRTATSKGAAMRMVDFKASVQTRLANAKDEVVDDVRKTLHIMDGLAYARSLPDQSVDLVLCDLPYGIDNFDNQSTGADQLSKFDDSPGAALSFALALVPELRRIVKPTGWVCLFMCYEFHAWLMNRLNEQGLTCEMPPWAWARPGSSNWGHFPDRHAANRYEMIVVAPGSPAARFAKKPCENLLIYPAVTNAAKLHNHQKPHELCRELIERFTVPGELVVDFCFGSGATLAAAADLGRRFAGSESNPAMLDTAVAHVAGFVKPKLGI